MKGRLTVLSAAAVAIAAVGADPPLVGPRFRGPDGSGVADGRKPPVEVGPDRK